ncbi:MAG: hypothetical protein ACAH11_01960 [Sphingomonas sp.]
MTVTIGDSVGLEGGNREADVTAVQQLLNNVVGALGLPALEVSGKADAATIVAITEYQRRVLKRPKPDGRVDPNGGTLKALNEAAPAPKEASAPAPAPATPTPAPSGSVVYAASLPAESRIVSDYAFKVIEKAVAAAGIKGAVITSTRRSPARQANAMYDNAAINLAKQYKMYGPNGDAVLKVFEQNRAKPKAAVVALMQQKIEAFQAQGVIVSNHVVTLESYAKLNVIDIGVGSTREVAGPAFNIAKLTKAFAALRDQGYIQHFIDETAKSNSCWHLEIAPGKKSL